MSKFTKDFVKPKKRYIYIFVNIYIQKIKSTEDKLKKY